MIKELVCLSLPWRRFGVFLISQLLWQRSLHRNLIFFMAFQGVGGIRKRVDIFNGFQILIATNLFYESI